MRIQKNGIVPGVFPLTDKTWLLCWPMTWVSKAFPAFSR
jgi:hypothetical protein